MGSEAQQTMQKALKALVGRLPLPNRTLLQYIIHFFVRISFCGEVPSALFGARLSNKQTNTFLLLLLNTTTTNSVDAHDHGHNRTRVWA